MGDSAPTIAAVDRFAESTASAIEPPDEETQGGRDEERYEWPHQDIEDAISWWRRKRWRNSLADLIEVFCKTREITGVELAHRLGHKTSSFVSRIRNSRIPVTRKTLQGISAALDLSSEEMQLLYAVAGEFSVVPIPAQRLGALVTAMRESDGLTQEKLAELLNLDGTSVSRLEQGQRRTDDSELAKLSDALPSARENPLVYFAAGRLPPDAVLRENEVAVAALAEYVRWLRISRESYREALDLIEPNLKLIRYLPLTPVVKDHYVVELLNSYADCLLLTGQMEEAVPIAVAASRSALNRSNAVQMADAQSLLASTYYALDRDRDAVHAADDGIEMMATLTRQHRGGLTWSYGQLQLKRTVSQAYVANAAGKLDVRLVSELDPWLEQRLENKDYAADALGRKAELLTLVGDVDGALAAWNEQQKAAAALGRPDARLYVLLNGIDIALVAHDVAGAERLLDQARRLAVDEGLGWSKAHIARLERKIADNES